MSEISTFNVDIPIYLDVVKQQTDTPLSELNLYPGLAVRTNKFVPANTMFHPFNSPYSKLITFQHPLNCESDTHNKLKEILTNMRLLSSVHGHISENQRNSWTCFAKWTNNKSKANVRLNIISTKTFDIAFEAIKSIDENKEIIINMDEYDNVKKMMNDKSIVKMKYDLEDSGLVGSGESGNLAKSSESSQSSRPFDEDSNIKPNLNLNDSGIGKFFSPSNFKKSKDCDRSFPTPGDLRCHMYIHTGNYPFNCDICKRGFSKKTSLKKHIQERLPAPKCKFCSDTFKNVCLQRIHLHTKHNLPLAPQPRRRVLSKDRTNLLRTQSFNQPSTSYTSDQHNKNPQMLTAYKQMWNQSNCEISPNQNHPNALNFEKYIQYYQSQHLFLQSMNDKMLQEYMKEQYNYFTNYHKNDTTEDKN
ncbi:hypothetical protein A3Q56_03710 [Intoshia linei]|uniref:C2H2-type domain-containing protein n=1 Tax=Intoshia linei TaxID=1819745 RepID=A0A177B353_9BILA|nr:hypothetical protein A3Q56_03710 [Intoshia linei]